MSAAEQMEYFIGFDVGTGSGRAALVDRNGKLIAEHTEPTTTWRSPHDHRIFEQSTTQIWNALATCSRSVLAQSPQVKVNQIKGIGFDATCSLAAISQKTGKSISVSNDDEDAKLGNEGERNVILWADHRAEKEAEEINASGEGVLGFVGGTMSLEMEIPKTLWLKRNMPADKFDDCMLFDLPDYLTYRATTSTTRSVCSLACKCSYVPPGTTMRHACENDKEEVSTDGWSARFFNKIGLGSMVGRGFDQLGGIPGKGGLILTAGQPVGKGLSKQAAEELGLEEGVSVGSAVIDAYAGWVGTIASLSSTEKDVDLSGETKPTLQDSASRLAVIAGTSTCHIVQSDKGVFVKGVWGPYHHAVFPGWWMNEGGQSSTGQLIDFMLTTHPAYPKLVQLAQEKGKSTYELLGHRLEELRVAKGVKTLTNLTKDLHFYPDLHGNRSPLADPKMRGMITGLSLDDSLSDLAFKFNVTLEAIALQTRHIIDEMNGRGHVIESIYMSGSQAKNLPLMNLLASTTGKSIVIPPSPSAAVVLGSAMLGRYAYEVSRQRNAKPIEDQRDATKQGEADKDSLWAVMTDMTAPGFRIEPNPTPEEAKLLDVKYKIFRESIEIQKRWREMIAAVDDRE